MGRDRKISVDDILDAAERVVLRLGAAELSIDAVAKEAGVSKSRVVYDHKSKAALLEAMVERYFRADSERTRMAVEAARGTPNPELFGRIAVAQSMPRDADRAAALATAASMSNDTEVQHRMRDWLENEIKSVTKGTRPEAALMAFLALSGLHCMECFGFYTWSQKDRQKILDGIQKIHLSYPETGDCPATDDSKA